MPEINIKDAKKVLEKLLNYIDIDSANKTTKENFKLVLRYLYRNNNLRKNSEVWIKSIENKTEFCNNVIENEYFNEFYYAHQTKSKYYKYYINKLGIVLLVKTNTTDIFYYDSDNSNSWVIPIGKDGCLNVESFKNSYKKNDFPMKIATLSVYELMQETFIKNKKDGYELHHIVCNNDEKNKNDARDNRLDNIIYIPKNLHVHTQLNGQDDDKAKDLLLSSSFNNKN